MEFRRVLFRCLLRGAAGPESRVHHPDAVSRDLCLEDAVCAGHGVHPCVARAAPPGSRTRAGNTAGGLSESGVTVSRRKWIKPSKHITPSAALSSAAVFPK